MAVAVELGAAFDFKPPAILFESPYMHPSNMPLSYDVAADGRLLMIKPAQTAASPPITVVLNWQATLPAREKR